MLKFVIIFLLSLGAIFEGATRQSTKTNTGVVPVMIAYFNKQSDDFYVATNNLLVTIQSLDQQNKLSLQKAKAALLGCRLRYKRISFFLDYFFPQQAWIYNAPSKFEVEEPYMEWEAPHGMQFIEEILFSPEVFKKKSSLLAQAEVIQESARDLKNLLYQFSFTDKQLFESFQPELIRIMALYISGYDAPLLKSGLRESMESLQTLKYIVTAYKAGESEGQCISTIDSAILYLKSHTDFDSFNRLDFLTGYCLPMGKQMDAFMRNNKLTDGNRQQITAQNLFGRSASDSLTTKSKIAQLGETLFNDKRLSGDLSRSCSSCHEPEKYFTDGLRTNVGLGSDTPLPRNTPTLFYAAHQSSQFWDGRARSLEAQVLDVLANPKEMDAHEGLIAFRLNQDNDYRNQFSDAFGLKKKDSIGIQQVSVAIAKYVETLSPMNSDFDEYIKGNRNSLSPGQVKGFNLFMGKAQCGSCHFIPYFNGSTPPDFNRSEYEVLGVPGNDDLNNPEKDKDPGRFQYFPAPFYLGAFKTPSLRNVAKTAPYMHNGEFRTLLQVMEFYNRGGGRGIGLETPHQTLSEKPLHLTKTEMGDIILFLNSLTDKNTYSATIHMSR